MAELVLLECDFLAAVPDGAGGLPRLPLLETLLARAGQRAMRPDWRGWLAPRFGAASLSLAATVASAWGWPPAAGGAPRGLWLATPVHFFAGIDSVHLHPAGVLQLDPLEQQRLVADFARVFADSPWVLHSIGRRELLLSGPALEASGADPDNFAGSDPYAGLPQGEGAPRLRALGAEVEMWLYQHALNSERDQRGELSVTALWLWGSQARAAPAPPHAPPPRLFGVDTYLEALCRLRGDTAAPLPAELTAREVDERADSVFLFRSAAAEGPIAGLVRFERSWLPAALQALRQGRVSVLWLAIGAYAYRLRRVDLARVWRRRRPWWQVLQ